MKGAQALFFDPCKSCLLHVRQDLLGDIKSPTYKTTKVLKNDRNGSNDPKTEIFLPRLGWMNQKLLFRFLYYI